MKKRILLVLLPVVLLMAGAFAVWGEQQGTMQPGCNKCAKMAQAQQPPCPNCPLKGADAKPACDKCPKGAAAMPACDKCPKMKGAEVAPTAAGCAKCAKMQQPDQPAGQPVPKECCKKKAM
ncbi:MAG: hypothetical protein FPO08_18695 [Geobacter sp.]|nr:MAG: hypothetical protein FPO08_18695 [Geobacter sp.]